MKSYKSKNVNSNKREQLYRYIRNNLCYLYTFKLNIYYGLGLALKNYLL